MKKRSAFPIAVICAAMLAGCSQPVEIPSSGTSTSSAVDPMRQPISETESSSSASDSEDQQESEQNGELTYDVTYGLRLRNEDVKYEDGKLVLTPAVLGGSGSVRLGIMLFIDGILQEYTVSGTKEKTFMTQYDTIPSEEIHFEMTVDAILDDDTEEHYIQLCEMNTPDFVPDSEQPWYGHMHGIGPCMQQGVSAENLDYKPADIKVLALENTVMTKEQADAYTEGVTYSPTSLLWFMELIQEDNNTEMADRFTLLGDADSLKLKFSMCAFGSAECGYRIGFFKNHMPCKFNGGYDFLDTTLAGSKITETEITIDDVEIGDVIYCIAIPKGEKGVCDVRKTRSSIVIGETDHTLV